jgi:hypothetical protein
MAAPTYDRAVFATLQSRLVDQWPQMTMRAVEGDSRTLIVLSSLSIDVPDHLVPLITAYEERYLCYVLILAKARNVRVVYITSQPVLPRLVHYYLDLIPGLDADDLRRRLTVVSVGDPSRRPLTEKVLERPLLIARLRELVRGSKDALLVPFMTTELEARLSVGIEVPLYGTDPALRRLGSKSGSRQVFTAAGVALPYGHENVRTLDDVVAAVEDVVAHTNATQLVVKTDESVSGFGNALVSLPPGVPIERAVRDLQPEDPDLDAEAFLALLASSGGIVEQRVTARHVHSPSVQLRCSPLGEVEVLSTHDQVLEGPHGQTYVGCRFPADPRYAGLLVEPAMAIGKTLAARGVIGRFGVDFVVTSDDKATWQPYAIEINLRNGGTTHPMITLQALTDGSFDADTGSFLGKHYVATDHLADPSFARLTPDDLLDVAERHRWGWDAETKTGVALHMVSAIAAAGVVGLTAVGDSAAEAQHRYDQVRSTLLAAAAG